MKSARCLVVDMTNYLLETIRVGGAAAVLLVVLAGNIGAQVPRPVEGPAPQPARSSTSTDYPAGYSGRWIEDAEFLYGPSLVTFDLGAYLAANAPHLTPYAEVISHWCGFYSISPKL